MKIDQEGLWLIIRKAWTIRTRIARLREHRNLTNPCFPEVAYQQDLGALRALEEVLSILTMGETIVSLPAPVVQLQRKEAA